MKNQISLATTTLALCLPLANTTLLAGNGAAPVSPCLGAVESVEILGASSIDARAEIACEYQKATESSLSASQDAALIATCMTKNPLMIQAATDASLVDAAIQLAWVTTKGTNWCTSLELLSSLPDID